MLDAGRADGTAGNALMFTLCRDCSYAVSVLYSRG